jgi:hypothetical protein
MNKVVLYAKHKPMLRSLVVISVSIIFYTGALSQNNFQIDSLSLRPCKEDKVYPDFKFSDTILKMVNPYADSIVRNYEKAISNRKDTFTLMPKPYFDIFFNRYFSYLSYNKIGLPDGNSATIQPTTNSTVLQANLAYKTTYTIYNFGLQTNFSNNIGNAISGTDVTSATSIFTNIIFLKKKSLLLGFNPNKATKNNYDKISKIKLFTSNLNTYYTVSYKNDTSAYTSAKKNLDSLIAVQQKNYTDSNYYKILKSVNDFNTIAAKVRSYGLNYACPTYTVDQLYNDISDKIKDSLKTIIDTMEVYNDAWTQFHFSWFSGGAKYTRQQYATYDSTLKFANRIGSVNFDNWAFTLAFNYVSDFSDYYIKWRGHKGVQAFYFTANYSLANDLNYAYLSPLNTLSYKSIVNNDSVLQFQSASTVRDISNKPKKIDWLHTFGLQTTFVLSNSPLIGFDASLLGGYSKFSVPNYTGKFGLLFRYINSDDQKSKVNFEIFLQLNDWEDSKHSGKSTWQRKSIGISTTIPFNKLFF